MVLKEKYGESVGSVEVGGVSWLGLLRGGGKICCL